MQWRGWNTPPSPHAPSPPATFDMPASRSCPFSVLRCSNPFLRAGPRSPLTMLSNQMPCKPTASPPQAHFPRLRTPRALAGTGINNQHDEATGRSRFNRSIILTQVICKLALSAGPACVEPVLASALMPPGGCPALDCRAPLLPRMRAPLLTRSAADALGCHSPVYPPPVSLWLDERRRPRPQARRGPQVSRCL